MLTYMLTVPSGICKVDKTRIVCIVCMSCESKGRQTAFVSYFFCFIFVKKSKESFTTNVDGQESKTLMAKLI